MPLFSANKLPCGPPAPPPSCPPSCFTPRPSPALSFSHCSSHHYVSGDTRLFCIRLFSPLWQAGQHANMQNGDGEAFCTVMRKGRRRNCERCRRVCVCLCIFQQILWLVRAMVGTGASATKTKAQLSNMAMEYHPKQPLILHGGIPIFCGLYSIKGTMQGKVVFFSTCIVTVNPHETVSANISGKLRRKGRGSSLRFPLLFTHILLSPTYLWRRANGSL